MQGFHEIFHKLILFATSGIYRASSSKHALAEKLYDIRFSVKEIKILLVGSKFTIPELLPSHRVR